MQDIDLLDGESAVEGEVVFPVLGLVHQVHEADSCPLWIANLKRQTIFLVKMLQCLK